MNDAQLLEQVSRTDRYPAGVDLPEALHADVVLRALDRRIDMDTKTRKPTPTTPVRSRWSGAWIAAASFAAIIAVAVAVALLLPSDGAEPAQTTVTTTVADTETLGDGISTAEPAAFAMMSAVGQKLSEGDPSRLLSAITPETTFTVTTDDAPIQSLEDLASYFAYGIALDSSWGRGVCRMGPDDLATCELIRTSPDYDPYGDIDVQVATVTMRTDGQTVDEIAIEFIGYGSENWLTIELEFMTWLEATHPADYDLLYVKPSADGVWAPNWAEPIAAAEIMRERGPEFRSEN